ncbi:rCG28799 [Rattus norvegicus]|uniref:RCG28799 n=1 Tax=Rattus norvegicus TaxID=10116 RepID=A6HV09_RAT|nr:rCG28799 [Rattus norvegicus]
MWAECEYGCASVCARVCSMEGECVSSPRPSPRLHLDLI